MSGSRSYQFVVAREQGGQRLDVFLSEAIAKAAGEALSRRKVRAAIDAGGVYVNQKRIRIASRAVQAGDKIRVEYSESAVKSLKQREIALTDADILYDEGQILAVNKPPGLPAQATRDQSVLHVTACLATRDRLRGLAPRPYVLVHRLDKETSGVILVAVGNAKATWLSERFKERTVDKRYLAVCHGAPAVGTKFTERAPLSLIDKKTGDVRVVRSGGRSAVTHVEVLASSAAHGVSLVLCKPETGRSHQIRVHLASRGLPIVGDKRYGNEAQRAVSRLSPALRELTGQHHFLHAWRLAISPAADQAPLLFEAPLPPAMRQFLEALQIKVPTRP